MIVEKLEHRDFIFYEVLRHPSHCWEFLMNVDNLPHEDEFIFTDYQQEFTCDFNNYVALCCARAVGKTESIAGMLTWSIINDVFPNDYIIYTVPNKAQLEPVWARITRLFRTNSVLKTFIYPKKGINSGTTTITLLTGATLICRIAGTMGDGRNVIGLHTPFEVVDEGGYYPWGTWLELGPTLNTWTPGARKIVSGVPTGIREGNVLYNADMQTDGYTKHRISAHRNPRYSKEDEQRSIALYGEPGTDSYIHFVLGRHGRPTFAVFDRALMHIEQYPVTKISMNGIELRDNISQYYERLALMPKPNSSLKVVIGVDLGYTDPTAITILTANPSGQLRFFARIILNKVPYPLQGRILDYLDTKYNPIFIGMDEGHAGIAEIQKLKMEPQFAHKNYSERIIPIRFNANITIGIDEDGKDITQKTRPFSISVLQEYSNEHRLVYSTTDLELISELERMVYIRLPSGNRVYRTLTPKGGKKGSDHITSSIICAVMAWYLHNESLFGPQKKKLVNLVRWNY